MDGRIISANHGQRREQGKTYHYIRYQLQRRSEISLVQNATHREEKQGALFLPKRRLKKRREEFSN